MQGIVDAPPAATEAAAAVPPVPFLAPPVPVGTSPFLAVSPSLELIAAAEHAYAVEAARDEAAFSDIRRQQNQLERYHLSPPR